MPGIRLSLASTAPDTLLKLVSSPDGPPNRMVRIFRYSKQERINVLRSGRLTRIPAQVYYEVSKGSNAWDNDAAKHAQGLFVTGEGDPASIWKVSRIERDAFDAPLITLSPLVIAGGFPTLDLSMVASQHAQEEIEGQYRELQTSYQNNAYRAVVTHAKNIAEVLIPLKANLPSKNTFNGTLKDLRAQMDQLHAKGKRGSVSELSYHLAQKLRLLHQRTHPERTIDAGRGITPQFAVTVVQDLVEILRDLGCVRG